MSEGVISFKFLLSFFNVGNSHLYTLGYAMGYLWLTIISSAFLRYMVLSSVNSVVRHKLLYFYILRESFSRNRVQSYEQKSEPPSDSDNIL